MSGTDGTKKPRKNTWPDERVEILKQLWTDGLSASQIAAKLGDGITRNAVIGKVHRLGLSGRGSPARVARPRTRRPRQPSAPKRMPTNGNAALKAKPSAAPVRRREPAPEPIRLVDIPEGERIGILSLTEKTCRWPLGDPGSDEFCFCGQLPQDGTPYCDYHASVAYQPANERRRPRKTAMG
ncbi:MAG TPA: GcrA cell cycle regulator [Rhizobiales bacterium]|nr:GcrA cell cycle regulator [Hyphomicrobiales bacterium]